MIFFVRVMIYGFHQKLNVKILNILVDMIFKINLKEKKKINIAL